MAFSRKSLTSIGLTDEQIDKVFAQYTSSVANMVAKDDVQAQIDKALEEAKASAPKPDITKSPEYQKLSGEFEDYKARTSARNSDEFKGVKGKFFDMVYDKIDRTKDIAPQLESLRKDYEEYFEPAQEPETKVPPTFSATPGRDATNPTTAEDKAATDFKAEFMKGLGFKLKD